MMIVALPSGPCRLGASSPQEGWSVYSLQLRSEDQVYARQVRRFHKGEEITMTFTPEKSLR